jgi:hypothetical protein
VMLMMGVYSCVGHSEGSGRVFVPVAGDEEEEVEVEGKGCASGGSADRSLGGS